MRILVLSDTHIPNRTTQLPGEVIRALESSPDLILHAGDLVSEELAGILGDYAPLKAVAGNMDPGELRRSLPRLRELDCGGISVAVMHGDGLKGDVSAALLRHFPGADVIVSGHTHRPQLLNRDGTWILNPGSPTDPRGGTPPSFGWIELSAGTCRLSLQALS
jgi:uncharacterized protein